MNARPGRQRQTKAITKQHFNAPSQPADLTTEQRQAWTEITSNPYISNQDHSMLLDYMTLVAMRTWAFDEMKQTGILIDDSKGSRKKNPAYQIFRECSSALLHIREALLMTPKARITAADIEIEDDQEDELAALVN